ncbi:MAG: tetratricopeptide repeat protein [Bacteroidales bacterium]|nr:tetratricopeptide repeat protein [Bacteroidales bacterium]
MKFKFAFHLVLLFFVIQACNQRSEVNSTGSPEVKQWIARVLLLATKERHSNDSIGILLDSAELSSKVLHLDSSRAAVLFWKGIIQYEENNYTDAEALFSEAKSIAEKNNYTRIHARCLERQASIHLGTDDPYLALKLYFQSLALCEKAGDSGGMAKVYNVLGFYKGQTGQFDSAVLLLNRAMEINRQLNDRRNMIENLGNLGYVYRQNGKNAEAEKIYHSLIAELIARNDSSSLPVIYYNMAAFRQEDHQLDSAIYYLRKAMVIAEITGDTALLSTLYGNTGEILMDKGSFDSSKVYLNRCLQYSILTDDVETQLQALKFLIKADTLSGKYNDIGSLYNRITVLQDSVFERKQRNNSRTIELQYENEKKRNLIELQEIEIQSKTKVRNLLLLLLITVIAAVVLLGRMIFLRKKNYLKDKLLLENKILLNQLQLDQLKKMKRLTG